MSRFVGQKLLDSHIVRGAMVVILVCAASLRIIGLDSRSLEADETFTVGVADPKNSLHDVVSTSLTLYHASKPPLYFLVTHSFLRLKDHDFLLRFPSMAFGVLGVAATYAVGAMLFGKEVGLVAAFLVCVSPLHIRHSQWSRFYTMLTAFSVLSLLFLLRGMSGDNRRSWLGFVFTSVLNLYTHAFAFLVLFSESLFFMLVWFRGALLAGRAHPTLDIPGHVWKRGLRATSHRRFVFSFIATLVIVALAYLPMSPHLLADLAGPKGIATAGKTPGLELSPSFFRGLLAEWSTGSGIALLIFLVLFFIGTLACLENQRREILLAVLWVGVPFIVLFAVPMQQRFYPRYLVFVLPIYLIVIARGVTACNDVVVRVFEWVRREKCRCSWVGLPFGLMVLGALSVLPLRGYYEERTSDWNAAAIFLASNISPGEGIMVRKPQFEIALLRYDGRLECFEFNVLSPREPLPSGFRYQEGTWFVGKEGRKNEMSGLEEELVAVTGQPVSKWVFEGYGDPRLPGAGESMFWDVWVLHTGSGPGSG